MVRAGPVPRVVLRQEVFLLPVGFCSRGAPHNSLLWSGAEGQERSEEYFSGAPGLELGAQAQPTRVALHVPLPLLKFAKCLEQCLAQEKFYVK